MLETGQGVHASVIIVLRVVSSKLVCYIARPVLKNFRREEKQRKSRQQSQNGWRINCPITWNDYNSFMQIVFSVLLCGGVFLQK